MFPQNAVPLIPQKEPFVLVDTLLHADKTSARCGFTIPESHVLVNNGYFTEGGLLENIAQTAAAHAGYLAQKNNEEVRAGFIASVKDLVVFSLPKAGDELQTEVTIENNIAGVNVALGTVWNNGDIVATCEMKIFIQEASE